MAAKQSISERFWSKVDRRGPDECWLWLASILNNGYGCFSSEWSNLAHRVAWELVCGPIPAGLCVLHRCDVKLCVNPAHLWLGTKADNNADCRAKKRNQFGPTHWSNRHPERYRRGDNHPARLRPDYFKRGDEHHTRRHPERLARGEAHGFSKLTEAQVREIRSALAAGQPQRKIGDRFGVSKYAIACIQHRKTWRHVI